jgi:acetyl-CoA acetyltransferase
VPASGDLPNAGYICGIAPRWPKAASGWVSGAYPGTVLTLAGSLRHMRVGFTARKVARAYGDSWPERKERVAESQRPAATPPRAAAFAEVSCVPAKADRRNAGTTVTICTRGDQAFAALVRRV